MNKKLVLPKVRLLFVIAFIWGFFFQTSAQWKTVRVGGGGFVTGFKAHTKVKSLYFITTDVGTPYRWNAKTQAWEGLFYNLPAKEWDRYAAGDLTFDPNDASGNILYVTLSGADSIPGTVLKSTDRGNTWTDCRIPIEVWPNSHKANKRLVVDPQNSNIVYVTTCSSRSVTPINGTYKSTKAGAVGSWKKVNDLYGQFIEFDTRKGKISGVTKNIYMGCADGVYLSTDGGKNFRLMTGSPVNPNRSSLHRDGTLYVTSRTGVHKWDGRNWVNITPPTSGNYSAVAVNPNNSLQVVCCSNTFKPYRFTGYRSSDGGVSWTYMLTDSAKVSDLTEVPWYATTIGQNLTEFCWDPFDQKEVWFTDFFFASQTTNIWASPNPIWKPRVVGEEEVVNTGNLLCPPSGKNLLITSIADAGGWDHKSLTDPPIVSMQKFFPWKPDPGKSGGWGNMTGAAVQETNPNFIARVGRFGWDGSGYAGYSIDGGDSYTQFTIPKGVAGGRIAVSATSETLVWVPQSGVPQRSVDRGASWQPITTLPAGIVGGDNIFSSGPVFPLAADKVNGNKFYVYKYSGGMYVSSDGGMSFVVLGKDLPTSRLTSNLTVETTPGKEGDVWVGMIANGLYHSTNSGTSFTKIPAVQKAEFIAVGKASTGRPNTPAVYVFGMVNNIAKSLFRSNDNGVTWENLGAPKIGRPPLCMAADRQIYGRVFMGTGGNGYFYCDGL
ncbi:MAG: hypothetical protein Q8904_06120 [Bacteroidota bacterium]|nr:hypothetical protein [Bacteroidota bacterium]